MKRQRQSCVLVVADFSKTSGRDFTAGVLRYARERSNWQLAIVQSPGEFTPARLRSALRDGVCGIITTEAESPEIRDALRKVSVPLVLVGAWHNFLKNVPTPHVLVVVNEERIGATGAEHLVSLGKFASFGFVHCPDKIDRKTSVERKRGFRKFLCERGFPCVSFDRATDVRALDQWIRSLPKPAGILAGYDVTAKMVIESCRRTGVKVPMEVSVLGIDNDILLCESARPTLSSLHIDPESLGYAAADELARLFRTRKSPRFPRRIVDTRIRLSERESTHPVVPAAHLIEKALAFISAHKDEPICVMDVVRHLGTSRRLVDLRFRQFAGESVLQAITSIRLEEAAARIRKSTGPISRIARELAFPDISYFTALFRKRFGLTPTAFRSAGKSARAT